MYMYMSDFRYIWDFRISVGSGFRTNLQVMNWKTKFQNTLKYSCRIYQLLVIEEDEMPTLIVSCIKKIRSPNPHQNTN